MGWDIDVGKTRSSAPPMGMLYPTKMMTGGWFMALLTHITRNERCQKKTMVY